jgi:hypothetical protein
MFSVITVVQQIMTEFNCAVSEEAKILATTKHVLNLKSNEAKWPIDFIGPQNHRV